MRGLQRPRSHWLQYGTVFVSNASPGGRPRAITQLHEQQLLLYLEARSMSYLDELVYMLFDEYDLVVNENTVWRTLYGLG